MAPFAAVAATEYALQQLRGRQQWHTQLMISDDEFGYF